MCVVLKVNMPERECHYGHIESWRFTLMLTLLSELSQFSLKKSSYGIGLNWKPSLCSSFICH